MRRVIAGLIMGLIPVRPGLLLAGAVLLWLAHPPFHLLLPSFVGLVPFILWIERLGTGPDAASEARRGGFFFGLVYFSLVLYWLFVALVYYTWLSILAFVATVTILAWFVSLAAVGLHKVRTRLAWPLWVAVPVFWTATEWLRGNLPDVAFPWMQLGDTLSGFPGLVGAADLVGARGISFWLALCNALVAWLWMERRGGRATLVRPGAVLVAVLAIPIGYSAYRSATLETRTAARVAVLQPNVPQHLKMTDHSAATDSALRSVMDLAAPWFGREQIDLVLLPETAIQLYMEPIEPIGHGGRPELASWLTTLADGLDADVAVGAMGAEAVSDDAWVPYNSAFHIRAPGDDVPPGGGAEARPTPLSDILGERRDKRHLVPLVERVPFVPPEWMAGHRYLGGSYGIGPLEPPTELRTVALTSPGQTGQRWTSYGTLICYESIFASLSRHYRRGGAEFLVNLTNDSWFGRDEWWSRSAALWQHPAHLVMRALENRVGIARAANTGVSMIVDPRGRMTYVTPLFEEAAFIADVETTDEQTVFVRFGDVTGAASAAAAVLAMSWLWARSRRRRWAGLSIAAGALLGGGLLWPAAVAAQDPDTLGRAGATPTDTLEESPVMALPGLTVTAVRPAATASGASGVSLSLASPMVPAAPLMSEALREMPFLQVRSNSRGEAQLTLRGTGSRQVAVLIDGVPLTLGWDARTDLSLIPLDAAREIVVYRGITSVLQGPNVLGGVVEVNQSRARIGDAAGLGGAQAAVDATGGTRASVRGGSISEYRGGRLLLSGGVGGRWRDWFPVPGPAESSAADGARRLNSDLEHTSLWGSARLEGEAGGWLGFSGFAYASGKGVPPELHLDEPRLWRIPVADRALGVLTAGSEFETALIGRGRVEAALGVDLGQTEIEQFESLDYESVTGTEASNHATVTARAMSTHYLSDQAQLRGALTWAQAGYSEGQQHGPALDYSQRLFSLGAEFESRLAPRGGGFWSRTRLSAGAVWDHSSTPRAGGREARLPIDQWGARVGGSAEVAQGFRAHVGASRRVRFPSLRELYSGALGRFVPNPDLRPEVLRAVEGGVSGTGRVMGAQYEVQAVLFGQVFSGAIARVGVGDNQYQRQNRDRTTATGLELLAAANWGRLGLGGDITLQAVSVSGGGPGMGGSPPLEGSELRAEYQPSVAGRFYAEVPLPWDVSARASLEGVGTQYCVNPEASGAGGWSRLSAEHALDAQFGKRLKVGGPLADAEITVALENLTDRALYDQCGLPRPGRLLRLQVRFF